MLLRRVAEKELDRWIAEAVVVEAAREHFISRRKAASLLGYEGTVDREAFFERHGLSSEYTSEMVEEDFATINALRAKR